MKQLRRFLIPLGLLGLLVLLAAQAETAKAGALRGLTLCATALLPSLFPFSVAANLWTLLLDPNSLGRLLQAPLRRLFHLPPAAAAPLLLGLVGGYPIGLQTLAALYSQGALSREEAVRLSQFCNNAGPAFLLGAAGLSVFGSLRIGLLLWLVHALSALMTGLLLSAGSTVPRSAPLPPTSKAAAALAYALPEAVRRSCMSMLVVCGLVVFFSTLNGFLNLLSLPTTLSALLSGALELTGGLFALPTEPQAVGFVLASALLAWGGLCVHFQGITALDGAGLPAAPYLQGKLLQTMLAVPLACLVAALGGLRSELPTWAPMSAAVLLGIAVIFCLFQNNSRNRRRSLL